MRRIRIHVEAPLQPGAQAVLPAAATQHLVRVLRLSVGDEVSLFNGDGSDYSARLTGTGKHGAGAQVLSRNAAAAAESPLRLTLVQALARGEKMDWVLQKATELGVAAIIPLQSERTEVRLDPERAARRMQHWRGVVVAACEQCGRAVLPVLSEPLTMERFAAEADATLQVPAPRLVLDPDAEGSIASLALPGDAATVAIGPEGGWSARDLERLRMAGFSGVRLGPRILRTETAGPVALAALQARFGDLG